MGAPRVAALGGAGALALGYGGYWAVQQQEVQRAQGEVREWSRLVEAERKAIASSTKQIDELTQRIELLKEHAESEQREHTSTTNRLEEARALVSQLEGLEAAQRSSAGRAVEDGKTALLRLTGLRGDAARAREALTLGEASLVVARQHSAEAQKLLNPLNHPRTRSFLDKLGTGGK